jgi:hypothetical protein
MNRLIAGMAAGAVLTLVGVVLFESNRSVSQGDASPSSRGDTDGVLSAMAAVADELSLLRERIDVLSNSVDSLRVSRNRMPDKADGHVVSQSQPPAPAETDIQAGAAENPQVSAAQEQAALNRLGDQTLTFPEFASSSEFTSLSPESRNRVMQEVVRRFNSGEIDRTQFVPGYRYK